MSFPQWKGLFDWSMRYHDGTHGSSFQGPIDEEKLKWLEGVLKDYMQDFAARMKEIKAKLDQDVPLAGGADASDRDTDQAAGPGKSISQADLEEREALLEELMDIVSSIDYARDLHKIGGLPTMLELLEGPHPSLVWRAAEVVATCVQNNPPVQQWFLEGGVMPRLTALLEPTRTPLERTKGLLALSSLIRHYTPGLEAFRSAGGLGLVAGCLASSEPKLSRKAMSTLAYMVAKRRGDAAALLAMGALAQVHEVLASDSSDMREGALALLCELALAGPACWQQLRDFPGLVPSLARLHAAHHALSAEDREAEQDELVLINKLQGLLALPQAPNAPTDFEDEVTAAQYEAASGRQQQTINVNPARASAAAQGTAEADAAGARDTGSGMGAGVVIAADAQGNGAGRGDPEPAPLLLGAPAPVTE